MAARSGNASDIWRVAWRSPEGRVIPHGARIGLALLAILAVHAAKGWDVFAGAGLRLYDLRVRLLASLHAPPSTIAIITIDEQSLRELEPALGRWPWPRAAMASVIDYCSEASVIGLDVLFSERDWQYQRSDDLLAEAVAEHGRVVSAAHLVNAAPAGGAPPGLTPMTVPAAPGALSRVESLNTLIPPFSSLLAASAGIGHVNAFVDADGIMRDHVPVVRCGELLIPSLPLALARIHTGGSNVWVDAENRLHVGEHVLHLGDAGRFAMLPSRWDHRVYSIRHVIQAWRQEQAGLPPSLKRETFRGRVVLIGSSATGLYADVGATPVTGRAPGVEILGGALENLLSGRALKNLDWAGFPLSLLLGAIPASRRFSRPGAMLLICAGLAVFYLVITSVALINLRLVLPLGSPLIALFAVGGVMGGFFWYEERCERRAMERLSANKDQMAAMLVHDLRNTLSPVVMGIDMLQSDISTTSGAKDWFLPILKGSTDMLLCQINSLLDIRRMVDGQLVLNVQHVPLEPLVGRAVRQFEVAAVHGERKLTLLETDPPDAALRVDRELVERVLMNLLWNAVKFATRHTPIELGWRPADADGMLTLYIRNHCAVIPPERLARLFKLYGGGTDTQRDGFRSMGLGLPFCRMAVEAHGGTIEMQSPCGAYEDGVELIIRLPLDR